MAAYEVVDFQDIIDAIREDLKVQPGDTTSINKIKRVINQVYLQEVIPFARWKWLEGTTTIIHKARYNAGTVSVQPNNATVTLSVAPPASQGSFVGKLFAVDGFNEIYVVAEHVAESTTIVLATEYQGNAATEAGFKIWTNEAILPTDCRETVNVYHNYSTKPMTGVGKQRYREISQINPRQEAYPVYYYTADFTDPSPLTPETESDRYRKLLLHPSIITTNCTLQIDYVKEVSALTDSGDEPVMPIEDRIVLVHGALARLWKTMASDNDNAILSKQDYDSKLARMAGKMEDSQDTAKVAPTSTYVRSMRAPRSRPGAHTAPGVTGGGGYNQIQFLEDVTIKGANVIANITVAPGVTIDGVDVSELETAIEDVAFDLSEHIALGSGAHAASAISVTPAGTISTTDVQAALEELDGDITTTNTLPSGYIKVGNASNVATNVAMSGDVTIDNTGATTLGSDTVADANVITGADIQRSKLQAFSEPDRVVITNGTSYETVSDVTSNELLSLVGTIPLATQTLLNNNTATVTGLTHVAATYPVLMINYSISRGSGNIECGIINVVNDGTSAAIAQGAVASIGSVGVTFSAAINGANVEVSYTTTNTGTNATMKYKLHKWG